MACALFTHLPRVEFDHQVRFHLHGIGHVGQTGDPGHAALGGVVVHIDVIGHVAFDATCSTKEANSDRKMGLAWSCSEDVRNWV